MKRNHLAFLMAAVMMLMCIFVIAPTVHAETPTEAPTEVPAEAPTDAPTEAPTDAPADEPSNKPTEKPSFITWVLTHIIRFFKWLLAYLNL